jgi:hypothetical protein
VDDWIGCVFHPVDRILWMGAVRISRTVCCELIRASDGGLLPVTGKQHLNEMAQGDSSPCASLKNKVSYQIKEVPMSLKPKAVTCQCGHTFTSSRDRSWCERCANAVYYHEKDKNKYKLSNMYITGVIVAVITFLTYVFMELIATPLLSL